MLPSGAGRRFQQARTMTTEVARTMAEQQPPRVILEVLTSSLSGKRIPLSSNELRKGIMLGRAPDCRVRFDAARDLKVSSHHALLEERDDGIYVRDQGSANGLYVNRTRAGNEGVRLYDGSEISLGHEGAVVRTVIPGEAPPPRQPTSLSEKLGQQPAPGAQAVASAPVEGGELTMVVEAVGARVGAGEKTKHLIKAVAEELEARQEQKRGSLATMVGALFMAIVAAATVGVWYYQHEEDAKAQAQSVSDADLARREQERDQAEKARQEREKEREKEMETLRQKLAQMETAIAEREKTLREEQDKRFEELKQQVDDQTASRVKEVSEAQLKQLREATEEELRKLQSQPSEQLWRDLVDRYNGSVFLIFVQYPLLNDKGEAVGIESGTGTGWLARTAEGKAWIVTNKHVIKPFLFKPELAISHAIQNVKPAPFKDWVIAAWQPGARIREKVGDSMISVRDGWATLPGGVGGKGGLKVLGFADDEMRMVGENWQEALQAAGFRTDLPQDIITRVKKAAVHEMDTFNDLAVLEFDRKDAGQLAVPLPIAGDDDLKKLHQLDPVISLGYPLGLSVIKGTTVTTSPATGDIRSLQLEVGVIGTSAPILPGNSGGPLIDKHGLVVGVITRRFEGTQGEAISAEHVRAVLKKLTGE
ncbi:MAG: FHA domain-containing protein [Planctomycetes bacterium]|nr:FHA domain-containing protein [Planctomycetota bacterium]